MTWLFSIKNVLNGKTTLGTYTEAQPVETSGVLADGYFDTDAPYNISPGSIDKKYLRIYILGSFTTQEEALAEKQTILEGLLV